MSSDRAGSGGGQPLGSGPRPPATFRIVENQAARRPAFVVLALFFAAYLVTAGFAEWLAIIPGTGISIWPPGGLYVATLIVAPYISWPWWIGAALGAELAANAIWFHNDVFVALLLHAGNALCAIAGAWLVRRFGDAPSRLETLRDVGALILLAGGIAPVIAATIGAATLAWWEGQNFANAWWLWWVGDATGVLLVAPLVLVALQSWRDKARIAPARLAEAAALGVVLLALASLSFDGRLPFAYIALPPILWAAVRFQFKGAVVSLLVLALLAAAFTGAGSGPFAGDPASQEQKHVMLQLFLAISALSALVVAAISHQHQQALRFLTATNDRLEQRVAERTRALSASEQRFRALADSVPVIVWVTDANGAIEFVNEEYERFFGITEAEVRRSGWEALVHPEDLPAHRAAFADAVQGQREFTASARVRRADGAWRYVAARGVPRFSPDGEFLGLVGVSPDVTSRKEHEDALAESDRQKDEFLAMLGHELRNPLAPVRNAVELLRQAGTRDPAVERARGIIERQVSHMVRLVDDLLDVSRVSRGKIALQHAPVDLAQVIRQAVETHRAVIDGRGHALALVLPPRSVWTRGDFTRLAQAVGNLIDNAAKYSERGGRITLTLERTHGAGAQARIRVRDTGHGIEPGAIDAMFEMFFQAESTLDRSEGGLGVGLPLVKRLVELHGGTVHASSAGRGQGSEFVITLPVLEPPEGSPLAPRPPVSGAPGRRVLVVDDNRDAAESLAALLRIEGHEVLTAYDGQRAVELALQTQPAAVLLDLGLPGLDGYAACRAIRAGGLDRALIVALTGYGQDSDQRATAEAGFDAHCVKPAELDEIRSLLARAG